VPSDRPKNERSDSQLFVAAAAAVARGDDLDDSLAELLGLADEHLGASIGALFIMDVDNDELGLAVCSGVAPDIADDATSVRAVANSHDPLADVARSRKPAAIEDAGHVAILRGAKTAYLLPLVVRRDGIEISLGAMALGFGGALPGPDVLAAAEPLADLAAVAVERALTLSLGSERAEWFDRLAHIDLLTGLANRRTVESLMELEVARAGRQGAEMSVAIFSIDGFDELQKTGGSTASDDVLRRVASVLSESVRLVDTVGRYGEDEFLLLAPGTDGMIAAERLAGAVKSIAPVDGRKVSVSVGLAGFPCDGRTPDELLDVATKAMKRARKAGGGRVTSGSPAAHK
jgi:diguanylate cyclase (GGDEF)-like protein